MLAQSLIKILRNVRARLHPSYYGKAQLIVSNLKKDTEMKDRHDECEEIDEPFLRTLPLGQIQVMNQTPTSHADRK